MKKIHALLCCAAILAGCSAADVPSLEESNTTIIHLQPKLEMMESLIDAMERPPVSTRDMTLRVNVRAINVLLDAVSGNRSDDIRVRFLPTGRLVEERTSTFGIHYTNYIDIDSGAMNINVKRLQFRNSSRNALTMAFDMEGSGRVHVTGKYAAITGSARPIVRAELSDSVRFRLKRDSLSLVVLAPDRAIAQLRTTIALELLGWEVPYSHAIPLRIDELLPPIPLPVAVSPIVQMPAPNDRPGDKLMFVPVRMSIDDVRSQIADGWIDVSFNIGIPPPPSK